MDNLEFQKAKIGDKVNIKLEWNNKVILEGSGIILDKAADDSTGADLHLFGKALNGNEFKGWLPRECCELIKEPSKLEECMAQILSVVSQYSITR